MRNTLNLCLFYFSIYSIVFYAIACGSHQSKENISSPTATQIVTIKVLNQQTKTPIQNAALMYNGQVLPVKTDIHGTATIDPNALGVLNNSIVLSASSFNYTTNTQRHSRETLQERDNQVVFLLQPIEFSKRIMLPVKPEDSPAQATLQHGATKSSLSIPFHALKKSTGEVVEGEVDVQITFYERNNFSPSYFDDDPTLPTLLAQTRDGGITRLSTMGMADINLYQNEEKLQVAPGYSLRWSIEEPAEMAAEIDKLTADNPVKLYYLNTQTNLWDEELGNISYDSVGRTLNANLNHLTHVNADVEFISSGTCYMGKIVDQCGDPVRGQDLFLTFIGKNYGSPGVTGTASPADRIKFAAQFSYRPLKTNNEGKYCMNAPFYSYDGGETFDYASVYAYPNIATKSDIISGICNCPRCGGLPSLNCYRPDGNATRKADTTYPILADVSGGQNFSHLSTYITISHFCSKMLYNQRDASKDRNPKDLSNRVPEGEYQKACYDKFLLDKEKQRCQACPDEFRSPTAFNFNSGDERQNNPNRNFYRGCDSNRFQGRDCAKVQTVQINIPGKICETPCLRKKGEKCEKTSECYPSMVCADSRCVCLTEKQCVFTCTFARDCDNPLKIPKANYQISSFKCINKICVPIVE